MEQARRPLPPHPLQFWPSFWPDPVHPWQLL